ncbi:hypothetical protein QFZ70_003550 [Arthrobacter sp. V1I9]|nr:hypothetical protein [Arthrobacter sp. V1I9]
MAGSIKRVRTVRITGTGISAATRSPANVLQSVASLATTTDGGWETGACHGALFLA